MKADKEMRCSAVAEGYGRVLLEMRIPQTAVEKTRDIFEQVPQINQIFVNPTVPQKEKFRVIERIFPAEMVNFLKTVCMYHRMELIKEIFVSYDRFRDEETSVVNAVLTCTTFPGEEQKKGLKKFLCEKYGAKEARIEMRRDDTLMGGFILRVGSDEYDRSVKGRADRLARALCGRTTGGGQNGFN